MLTAFFILSLYVAVLLAYNPNAGNLKDRTKMPLSQRFYKQKGTLLLGALFSIIYGLSVSTDEHTITDVIAYRFGLSYMGIMHQGRIYQLFTSAFLHVDLVHVCGNLFALALLSAYERRVGYKRFLLIFLATSIVTSFIDLIIIDQHTLSMGASAGICGLTAGFFIDYPQTTAKEWLAGVCFVLVLVAAYTFYSATHKIALSYEINWLSHFVGAVAGAVLIRLRLLSNKSLNT